MRGMRDSETFDQDLTHWAPDEADDPLEEKSNSSRWVWVWGSPGFGPNTRPSDIRPEVTTVRSVASRRLSISREIITGVSLRNGQ